MPLDEEVAKFYGEHCAKGGVVLAMVIADDKEMLGIFSTADKAEEWVNSLACETSSAVFAPYFVDYPQYGNEKAN